MEQAPDWAVKLIVLFDGLKGFTAVWDPVSPFAVGEVVIRWDKAIPSVGVTWSVETGYRLDNGIDYEYGFDAAACKAAAEMALYRWQE